MDCGFSGAGVSHDGYGYARFELKAQEARHPVGFPDTRFPLDRTGGDARPRTARAVSLSLLLAILVRRDCPVGEPNVVEFNPAWAVGDFRHRSFVDLDFCIEQLEYALGRRPRRLQNVVSFAQILNPPAEQ